MTIDSVWKIINDVHIASKGNMDAKCELLAKELRALSPEEVKSFSDHFDACEDRAYTWELWAAAYIIGGGCSDDGFSDFRATLISMGRDMFERVVASPGELVHYDLNEESAFYEGYQYVVNDVYEEMTGDLPERVHPAPDEPSGVEWDEEKVSEIFPALAKKYGY
jgi:hypothetical protein